MSDNSGNSSDSYRLKDKQLAEHVAENRSYWDSMASDWVGAGQRSWQQDSPTWGIWGLPESQLQLLPVDMTGMKAIELGCGTGYVSAWMTRRGAHVTGIDNSLEQLKTAERLMKEYELEVDFFHGNAEDVPYPDASFDFAINEYGAAIWCDPLVWIPEAYRLLKPGGWLTFLGTHPIAILATPDDGSNCDDSLHRPYFGMHQQDWGNVEHDPGGIEFNLSHSDWYHLFQNTGFEVLDYLELQAPEDSSKAKFSIPAGWGQKWPSEQVWKLRKKG